MRRQREGREGRGGKAGEKPGQALGSSSLLILGPAVNSHTEEKWAAGTLILRPTATSNQFLVPGDSITATYLVLLLPAPPSALAGHERSF